MYLLGASGHAKVIIDILESSKLSITGLFDRDDSIGELRGYKVSTESDIRKEQVLLIAIGNNSMRKQAVGRFPDNRYITAIHPQAIVDRSVELSHGTVVMGGAIINAATVIGHHAIVNTGASVDHDCTVGDFAHICPHATLCGGVSVGEGALIGAGATLIPLVKVGRWSTVGAGAVVVSDVPDYSTVVGNPARVIER